MRAKPFVSVIMRSRNSDWIIAQAIGALYSQTFKDFELIVVDSNSKDRTLEIINEFPAELIKIKSSEYYPGTILNMAIKEAKGKIIVFQNSDAVPVNQFALERLIAPFKNPEIQATCSRQIPRPDAALWVQREYEVSFPDIDETPSWISLSLPMAAMRKSAWEEHHFYADAWGSEDSEWGHWAEQNGKKIQYVKDALVMHSHNYTLRQLYGRKFIEGEADAFINRDKYTILKAIKQFLGAVKNDLLFYLKKKCILGIFYIPIRRSVQFFSFYKAHKFGEKRIKTGDKNRSRGQKEVLSRYE